MKQNDEVSFVGIDLECYDTQRLNHELDYIFIYCTD
jgi:hypothetical protein